MKGPRIVPLDHKAKIRRVLKKLVKEVGQARHLSYVIELENSMIIYSTHQDDHVMREIFEKARNICGIP